MRYLSPAFQAEAFLFLTAYTLMWVWVAIDQYKKGL